MRLFMGIALDSEIAQRVADFGRSIKPFGRMTFVKPEVMHVNLKFLGETDEKKVMQAISKIEFEKFDLKISGIGVFPSREKINTIWAGAHSGELEKLQKKIEKIGFKKETRPYKGHITIARVKSLENKSELLKVLDSYRDKEFGVQKVEGFELNKVTLTPDGPIYEVLLKVEAK